MTREEAEETSQQIWGPKAEAVRVSSQEKDNRFVIAYGSFRRYPLSIPEPVILGSGGSWESAIDHARTTPNGKMAEDEHKKGMELVKEASKAKTPLEFADKLAELSINEAKEKGLPDAAIEAMKLKFQAARKKIKNVDDRKESEGKHEVGENPYLGDGDEDGGKD